MTLPQRAVCRFVLVTASLVLASAVFGADEPAQAASAQTGIGSSEDIPEVGQTTEDLALTRQRVGWHIPDPEFTLREPIQPLERPVSGESESDTQHANEIIVRQVESIRRPEAMHLSLEDALGRALANNFDIEVQRYAPAIAATQVVEAEAAFDAVFFSSIGKSKLDQPTGSQLFSGDRDEFNSTFGIRKLLPSGMRVSGSYGLRRLKTALSFQTVNPEYFSTITMEMQQPFLKGHGIDYNRSVIRLRQNELQVSRLQLLGQVQNTLRETEEAYWRVVQARRDIVVTARLLAGFEVILRYLESRSEYDALPVQIAASKADLEASRFDFITRLAALYDAEDQLIAVMNDPEINLADEIEIIPTDFPNLDPIVLDRLAEVQTALDNRPEIKEQELQVASAKIYLDLAKNEELPRLDATFRYTIDGLATNADRSFDEATTHNYVDYFVGVEFEMPIGNRGPRAAHHRARLQHSQAAANLRSVIEKTILDVNFTARALSTSFDQILPSFDSAEARLREVDSIVARTERKDFNTLNTELGSRKSLALARRAMLAAVIDYNIAVIRLEAAKGTLLRYNNVVIAPIDGE